MAKNRRRRSTAPVRQQNDQGNQQKKPNVLMLLGQDGYINKLAYLGEASELNEANDYERHSISRDYELLTVMYRENWIAKRIIDTPCEDMTRSWYSVVSTIDQDKIDELAKLEAKHNIKQEITNGLRWARLYGGSAAVMVIKDQEDMLDQPLNYDDLVPGCFRGLIIVDRTSGLDPSMELEEDYDDPEYGYPKYYTVQLDANGTTMRIHHSRMLFFRGRMLPIVEERNDCYWGASELEHVYEELQKRNSTSANIAQLIFQANVGALKMADYGEIMGMGTEAQKRQIYDAIHAQNRIRNSFGMMIMGAEDSYEQHAYSFSGLSEVYETFMMDMAGAAEIPATKLYGRSPQGMNATGESDMKNYYEMLAGLQEKSLRPAIEKLLPVMCASLWGKIPEDMEVVFEPLQVTTPAEKAQIAQQITGVVIQAYNSGLISQRTALEQMRKDGKELGIWDVITDELIEKASDEIDNGEGEQDPMGMMGAMGGGMPPEGMPPEGMPPEEQPEGEPEAKPEGKPEEPPQKAPKGPSDGSGEVSNKELAAALKQAAGAEKQPEKQEEKEEAKDGGPGSGPKPGYHKNGTKAGLVERASFIANPTAGMEQKRQSTGMTGTKAQVEKNNQERKDWSNLTTYQKVQGNAEQEKHMANIRKQMMNAALKGDLDTAKRIVKENRQYFSNDPDSAMKVQSETLERQKAVKPHRGFLHDAIAAIMKAFGRDAGTFKEEEHPRDEEGKFTSGSGSAKAKIEEPKAKEPANFEMEMKKAQSNQAKMAETPVDKGTQKSYNIPEESPKPVFTKTEAKKFRETFHAAKAEVAKNRPQDAWRVDSTYTDEDYEDMECYTTHGGSAVAVHDGDIVSVCANPNDKTTHGRDLLAHARSMGGNKLDAFGKLYGFYIKNGFEPVSWCEFDERYAPDGWTKGRDEPEPVIFFKHTGRSRDDIAKDFGSDHYEYVKRVKASSDYDAAKEVRDKSLKG